MTWSRDALTVTDMWADSRRDDCCWWYAPAQGRDGSTSRRFHRPPRSRLCPWVSTQQLLRRDYTPKYFFLVLKLSWKTVHFFCHSFFGDQYLLLSSAGMIFRQLWKCRSSMSNLCESICAGGYGTLEELLEITTWSQLGIHAKPVSKFSSTSCPAASGAGAHDEISIWEFIFMDLELHNFEWICD